MGSANIVKTVAEEYADRIWNKRDLLATEELLDSNVIIHSLLGNFQGVDSMKKIIQSWLTGFPDLIVENMAIASENDRVFLQWKANGTHSGIFKGIAPTNHKVNYEGVTIYRINMGKIVEYWSYTDMLHIVEQLR